MPRTTSGLHREAMDWAERAVIARTAGDAPRALECNKRAFQLAVQAAERMRLRLDDEPSRSVLYRSAACLAFDCGEFFEVKWLVAEGLAGSPPADIRRELEEVGLKVTFRMRMLRN